MRNKAYQFLYIDASDSVKRLREPRKQVHGMAKEAVKALLATPDPNTKIGLRDIAIMSFEYGTATRIDEVLSVKISQLHMNGEKPYVTVIGKGSKIRSMYLMSGLVDTLKKYISVFHGENPEPEDYLFYSSWHGLKAKLSQEAIRKRLKLYAAKAHAVCPDVPTDLHSHQWRHAKACHWLEEGINIVEISKLLGHESLETTMIYQDITREKQIRALATLDEEISKGTPKKWKQPNAGNLRDYFCFV
jgi:site-specific recombinase XerD